MLSFLLTECANLARGFFDNWKAKQEDARKVAAAVTENRLRLAADAQTHNEEWEMRALEGRDNFLRRASFVVWSAPIIWAAFDPAGVAAYFKEALGALPSWYVAGYLAISGAVWGLSELKAAGVIKP